MQSGSGPRRHPLGGIVSTDIVEAHCYGFQMISCDNEQSRSRQMQ